jgi:hypothetical protein
MKGVVKKGPRITCSVLLRYSLRGLKKLRVALVRNKLALYSCPAVSSRHAMADKREAHSSGEYSGVVEEATYGVPSKPTQLATVISSGNSAKKDREEHRARREREAREEEERQKASKA